MTSIRIGWTQPVFILVLFMIMFHATPKKTNVVVHGFTIITSSTSNFKSFSSLISNQRSTSKNSHVLYGTTQQQQEQQQKQGTETPITKTTSDLFFVKESSSDVKTNDLIVTKQQLKTSPDGTNLIPLVQRKYETFQWFYQPPNEKNNDNNNVKVNTNSMSSNNPTTADVSYNINYRVVGPVTGEPILLVHGFGANLNHYRYQYEPLAKAGYRVYGIDLIGFGASDKPTSPTYKKNYKVDEPFGYSIELFTQLLNDFIVHINSSQQKQGSVGVSPNWIIGGNSIGGLCCLLLASQRPDMIKAVTLFNCAGGMTIFRYSELPWFLRPLIQFFQTVFLGPTFGPNYFKNFKTKTNVETILKNQGVYCDPNKVDEDLLDILLQPSNDVGAEKVFLQVFGGPPGPTPESILPHVQCPILACWGEKDPWTPVDGGLHPGNTFGQYNSNYTLHVLPNTGHCPQDESPELIHPIMINWLQNLNSNNNNKQQQPESVITATKA